MLISVKLWVLQWVISKFVVDEHHKKLLGVLEHLGNWNRYFLSDASTSAACENLSPGGNYHKE